MTKKICFCYDGSPEAKQALKWINKTFNKYWYHKHGDHFTNEGRHIWKAHDINFTYQLVPPAEFLRLVKGEEDATDIGAWNSALDEMNNTTPKKGGSDEA